MREYFSSDERPVSFYEFSEFWDNLEASEQLYFMAADLCEAKYNMFEDIADFLKCSVTELHDFWHGLTEAEKDQILYTKLA